MFTEIFWGFLKVPAITGTIRDVIGSPSGLRKNTSLAPVIQQFHIPREGEVYSLQNPTLRLCWEHGTSFAADFFHSFTKCLAKRVSLREMTINKLIPRNFCYNSHVQFLT